METKTNMLFTQPGEYAFSNPYYGVASDHRGRYPVLSMLSLIDLFEKSFRSPFIHSIILCFRSVHAECIRVVALLPFAIKQCEDYHTA